MKNFLTLQDLKEKELGFLLKKTAQVKKGRKKFEKKLEKKTLIMFFEKPSLRTRVSFETGMTQLGGHAIFYDAKESTIGKKETIEDFARVVSRYCDIVAARVYEHEKVEKIAKNSRVPVINMLSNDFHPCQALADLFTIAEKKKKLKGLKLAYFGDANNNVTHSLLLGCAMSGVDCFVCCPQKEEFLPKKKIVEKAKKIAAKNNSKIVVSGDAAKCAKEADAIYTDSWMSYNVPENRKKYRMQYLQGFQVNEALMRKAKKNALFLHCLPATRGMEVTSNVMDGKQSIVFEQAENRLHAQKALMLWLLGKG